MKQVHVLPEHGEISLLYCGAAYLTDSTMQVWGGVSVSLVRNTCNYHHDQVEEDISSSDASIKDCINVANLVTCGGFTIIPWVPGIV